MEFQFLKLYALPSMTITRQREHLKANNYTLAFAYRLSAFQASDEYLGSIAAFESIP